MIEVFTPLEEGMDEEKPRVIFAPGDFDDFTGTQAELDETIRIITEHIRAGTYQENFGDTEDQIDGEFLTDEEMDRVIEERIRIRARSLH